MGYIKDNIWREDAYLVEGQSANANERPAMVWLKNYVNEINSGCDPSGPVLSIEMEKNNFEIFPNPIQRRSNLKLKGSDIKSIIIRDIYGRKVLYDYSLNAENYLKIDLQMGIYILEIVDTNDKSIFKKLIVK